MRLGMPGRVLITRPTFPGGGQVPGTSDRPRGLRHNDPLPKFAAKESRTHHLSGVTDAPSHRSHVRTIILRQPKGKWDARSEMVQDAHGAAPGQRYEYYLNAPNRVRVTAKPGASWKVVPHPCAPKCVQNLGVTYAPSQRSHIRTISPESRTHHL